VSGSRQREWLRGILEGAPSILFLLLLQNHFDMRIAGWTGAALAALVLVGFGVVRVPQNPIALGINMHLLVITPLIVVLFYVGAQDSGRMLFGFAYRGVLVTIFVVGCVLTASSRRGFIGVERLPPARRWSYSLILLAATAAAVAWSFTYNGPASFAVAIPIMALFGLQRLLIARWLDRGGQSDGSLLLAPGSALTSGDSSQAT
jgi:hypothetical protein